MSEGGGICKRGRLDGSNKVLNNRKFYFINAFLCIQMCGDFYF